MDPGATTIREVVDKLYAQKKSIDDLVLSMQAMCLHLNTEVTMITGFCLQHKHICKTCDAWLRDANEKEIEEYSIKTQKKIEQITRGGSI
jgi:hypothetical protein